MIAAMLARREMARFLKAFEHKDFDGMAGSWAPDVVMEFPAGLPMAGSWCGKEEVRSLFEAIFDYNEELHFTLRDVAVTHPWSPSGDMTVIALWDYEERSKGGDLATGSVVSTAECHHWKGVHTRDYFFDVPGLAHHYADIELPARPGSREGRPAS